MDRVEIMMPDNWHCHFRQGPMMMWMVKMLNENGWCGRVLSMPNTNPPILNGEEAMTYFREISTESFRYEGNTLTMVPTIQITEQTTPQMIKSAWRRGIRVAKVYPRYVTTNSENGVVDYTKIYPALSPMEDLSMVACFHPEHPSYSVEGLLKEAAFTEVLDKIRMVFPRLRVVVEHVTTGAMARWVYCQPVGLVGATITSHHLFITMDDVLGYSEASGGKMNVHNGCKPQAKWREDRDFLVKTALSGDPHFFYGGDDAPHLEGDKHSGSCGVFNTTVALPLLIELFVNEGKLLELEQFLSVNGARFYGYKVLDRVVSKTLTFICSPWQVPSRYPVPNTNGAVVPFMAEKTMKWKLVE